MVVDDDVLEKDDLFILDRMKEFLTTNAVANFPAAKQLLILIERAVSLQCTMFGRGSTDELPTAARRRWWRDWDGRRSPRRASTAARSKIEQEAQTFGH